MNLTFVTNKISGRGGTETVLVKVLNNLAKNGNSIRLVLSNLTPNKEWLHNLDPSIKIVYPKNSDKFTPRTFLSPALEKIKECVDYKQNHIFNSVNRIKEE